jgi:hypothetical protein
LLKGTRILRERLTDIEIIVISAPRVNITNGWYTRRDTCPTWLSLSDICGKHLSNRLKLNNIIPKPIRKTAHCGKYSEASTTIG